MDGGGGGAGGGPQRRRQLTRVLAAAGLALVAGALLALGPLKPLLNHFAYLVDGGAFTSEPTSKTR